MYMSRQALRLAVLQKFNDYFKLNNKAEVSTFDDLFNAIENININASNEIINSLRICDPAVGSGHFLVSVLNELIVIKSELKILIDKNGKRLKDYEIEIENDELIISDETGIFEYRYNNKESQRVQETIFNEKQTLIENCLFGVDINPNSVQICRLRLWIELLKSSYYRAETLNLSTEPELETLPNIDINIKCGNSLLSRFDLDSDLVQALKKSKWNITSYRNAVATYRNTKSREVKWEMEKLISEIKNSFETEIWLNDKRNVKLSELRGELYTLTNQEALFEMSQKEKDDWNKKVNKLTADKQKQEQMIEEIRNNAIYKNAFEWRFEFPEVLNDKGDFVGFDVVIGNPPYISAPSMVSNYPETRQAIIDSKRFTTLYQKWDLYIPFIELGLQFLSKNGAFAMIIPYPLTNQNYAMKIRELIVNQYKLVEIVDLNGTKIFDSATVSNCIPIILKSKPEINCYISKLDESGHIQREFIQKFSDLVQDESTLVWNLTSETRESNRHSIMNILGDYCYISKGMVLNADEKTAKGVFVKDDLISDVFDVIHCRKYIEAKDIERYNVKRIRYLEYNSDRCPNKLSRPTFRELYDKPKLMFNRLGKLMVIYDEEIKFLHSDSMYSAVLWKDLEGVDNKSISASIKRYSNLERKGMVELSKNIDLRYLLGVLNSKYASVLLTNLRGGDYHIYPEHIRNLPIPKVSIESQQPFIDLVDIILAKKPKNEDTSQEEREIDRLVYQLYDLTDEEIKIVEGE